MKLKLSILVFAILLLNCKEKSEAETKFVSSKEVDESRFPILEQALFLKQNSRFFEAIDKLRLAENDYGPMASIYINRADIYYQLEKWNSACDELQKAKELESIEEFESDITSLSVKFDCRS